ncbi:hypothetical protein [Nonomuraea sp. NPDC048826]|uniref:hypothetical protein n=1 Tax=Nonomuraea sp. NPDC048826 TaxID=3364347 RepID=UPI00370FC8CD
MVTLVVVVGLFLLLYMAVALIYAINRAADQRYGTMSSYRTEIVLTDHYVRASSSTRGPILEVHVPL